VYEEKINELFQVCWKPAPGVYSDRPPSPRVYSASKPDSPSQPPKPGKYVHPNAKFSVTGGNSIKKSEDDAPVKYKKQLAQVKETVIGFTPEPSKTSKRNQKRREKKKNPQETTENDKEEDSTQPDNSPEEEQQEDVVDYQKKDQSYYKEAKTN